MILRRKPVEGYDISFLITNTHLEVGSLRKRRQNSSHADIIAGPVGDVLILCNCHYIIQEMMKDRIVDFIIEFMEEP